MTLPNKTPDDLYEMAERRFGFTREKSREILLGAGFTGFHHDAWWSYTEALRMVYDNEVCRQDFPKECPVCKERIERDSPRDGKFGVRWGWKCTANRFHFMEYQWSLLRAKIGDYDATCDSPTN